MVGELDHWLVCLNCHFTPSCLGLFTFRELLKSVSEKDLDRDEVDVTCCPSEFGDCHTGAWAAMGQGCWEKAKAEIELSGRHRQAVRAEAVAASREPGWRWAGCWCGGVRFWLPRLPTVWLDLTFPAVVSLSVKWAHARCLGQGFALGVRSGCTGPGRIRRLSPDLVRCALVSQVWIWHQSRER